MRGALPWPFFSLMFCLLCLVWAASVAGGSSRFTGDNYKKALDLSIQFFEGQRSGKLDNKHVTWRGDSGLNDGREAGVNLIGGYYDAGDNVKFNFPMAYTITMLSWSALEYGRRMGSSLPEVRAAIKWATDYLLECATATDGKLYVGVGNGATDHQCWMRPEDMTTPRTVYAVSPANPGSDVAAETAAALAAASMVFRTIDPRYSKLLRNTARKVFQFAYEHRGSYSDSVPDVRPYYNSYSGYNDELLWGAAWLFRATNLPFYHNYTMSVRDSSGAPNIFSWDDKHAGANVLLSRYAVLGGDVNFDSYKQKAASFMCNVVPGTPFTNVPYTRGGLIYMLPDVPLQYTTSATFLITTFAKYLSARKLAFKCGDVMITPSRLRQFAKTQVDYILGANPMGMSYMVGFGTKFPERIHHRGSSITSIVNNSGLISCQTGFSYYYSQKANPNTLYGAVVGGPDTDDRFADDRTSYSHSEPATATNAPLVGALAYFASTKSK